MVEHGDQAGPIGPQVLDHGLAFHVIHGGDKRRQAAHFRAMGCGEQEHALGAFKLDGSQLHDVPTPCNASHCKSVRHGLAEGTDIGLHTVKMLRALQMPSKARNHLIEDKDDPMLFTQGFDLLQKVRPLRCVCPVAHLQAAASRLIRAQAGTFSSRRLQHYASNLSGVFLYQTFQRSYVVVVKTGGVLDGLFGNAARQWGIADEPVIKRKERLLSATGYDFPACECAGQLHSRRDRCGSIFGELDHIDRINQANEALRRFELDHGRACQVIALPDCRKRCLVNGLFRVAKMHRTQSHAVIQKRIALWVPDIGTFPAIQNLGGVRRILVVAT